MTDSKPKKETPTSIKDAIKVAETAAIRFIAREAQAAENFVNADEQFDNFLPITMGFYETFYFNTSELRVIRDFARILSVTDEIVINIIKHYVNHIVGDGITLSITPKEMGKDPSKLADTIDDPAIKELQENWEAFWTYNDMDCRLQDWVKRAHRDGEVFLRIFDKKAPQGTKKVPVVRFVDPFFITDGPDARLGLKTDPLDAETILGYWFRNVQVQSVINGTSGFQGELLKPDEIIHDKRNTDYETKRGLSSFYAIFTNLRRCSKNMVNVSVLTSILSAIALVRKHQQAQQSKIDSFLQRNSDGKDRTNAVSGNTQYARQLGAGTVIDAPMGTEYDFPAHNVKTDNYINVIDKELAMIANAFVLPVEWLKAGEPVTPITDGSPCVKNFQHEQAVLFDYVTDLFWRVQKLMGVDIDAAQQKYQPQFFGPDQTTGSELDRARTNEIEQRAGVLSPQTWAATKGRNYVQERANSINHRKTAQPGEVMPGDAGNTNVTGDQTSAGQGGDGTTKKGGGQKGGSAADTAKVGTKEEIHLNVNVDATKDQSIEEDVAIEIIRDPKTNQITGGKRTKVKAKPNGTESTAN